MRVPLPTRISVVGSLVFSGVLALVQLLEKTDPLFTFLTFCFLMVSVFAFNTAGGFTRPSGAYVFFFSLLVVDVGVVFKACMGEPAQTHLANPLLLMSTYLVSITGMWLMVFVNRKISTSTEGIAGLLNIRSFNYFESALGCLVVHILIHVLTIVSNSGEGQLLHSVVVVDPFLPLATLLAVVAAIHDSGGRRSTGPLVWFVTIYAFLDGALYFSKQGMFTPVACWLIAVAWTRYQMRLVNIVFLVSFGIFAQFVLTPMANFGRDEVGVATWWEREALVEHYLTHIGELRQRADEWEAPLDFDARMFYYDRRHGLFDRLTMMPNDSVLIDFSNQGHYFGYLALRYYFEDWVPHIIEPHKLEGIKVGGNAYMHEMGGLPEEDESTGISFSGTAEAFHLGGWPAVIFAAPAVWLLMFVTGDFICGDLRKQPLGLLYVLMFAHVAPEGGLGGTISLIRLLNVGMVLAIAFCGYVTPVLGMLLRGKHGLRDTRTLRLPTFLPAPGAAASNA